MGATRGGSQRTADALQRSQLSFSCKPAKTYLLRYSGSNPDYLKGFGYIVRF